MPAKKKPIYSVYCTVGGGFGFGLQPVKANNKAEARRKFKKRFPKQQIIDVDRWDGKSGSSSYASRAI